MFDRRTLITAGGVLAFAITLGIVIGTNLQSPLAQAVGLGVAAGVVIGMLTGGLLTWLILRRGGMPAGERPASSAATLHLSKEQAETLFLLLEGRTQTSPANFPLRARPDREFAAVGGAELPHTDEDQD